MTREHKLALIVGFSLILLVGVLISDHLSRARESRLVEVAADDATSGVAPVPQLPGPFEVLASRTVEPAPDDVRELMRDVLSPGLANADTGAASGPAPLDPIAPPSGNQQTVAQAAPSEPLDEPTVISMDTGPDRDTGLLDAFREIGAEVVNGEIRMPAAATLRKTPEKSEPVQSTLPLPSAPLLIAATPIPTNVKLHPVRPGETLIKVSERYYGDGTLWRKLAEFNKERVGANGVLRSGVTLRIPERSVLTGKAQTARPDADAPAKVNPRNAKPEPKAPKPEIKPGKPKTPAPGPPTYTVKKGDTLGAIASRVLGSSKRAKELIALNRDVISDGDQIIVGMVLKVPETK